MNLFHSMAEDFQRWELPDLGLGSDVSDRTRAAPQPTVHELEALEQQARDEGYAAAATPLQLLDDQAAEELAQLAVVVARRVIVHELSIAPERIAGIVRQAAAALPLATRELRVHLHPQDLALLQELGMAERHWQLLADPALARGDCRLESERSRLDARVETRLTAIIDAALGDEGGQGGADA